MLYFDINRKFRKNWTISLIGHTNYCKEHSAKMQNCFGFELPQAMQYTANGEIGSYTAPTYCVTGAAAAKVSKRVDMVHLPP